MIHPTTGLRVLGFTKRGDPIWPVMGGAPTEDDVDMAPVTQRTGITLTYSQSVHRIAEIEARMTDISTLESITPEQDAEYRELLDEAFQVDEHRKRLERADDLAKVKSVKGQVDSAVRTKNIRIVPGSTQGSNSADYDRDSIMEPDSIEDCRFRNPWDLREMTVYGREPGAVATELRSRALSAISKMQCASDNIRSAATYIIENFDSKDSRLARQCLVTSTPAYLRAWSKMATNKAHALSPDEQRALNDVEEFRAMSLTDAAGGYLTPFQLDPTVIVTSSGVRSDIRQKARVVVAISDVWNGVSSQNVSWSFDAEASEVSDDSTTFAQPSIPNYMARGFVPISIEAMADEINVAQQVGILLANGKDDLEGTKFILGSGTAEPTGLITALTAAGGATVVASTTAATFALADIYLLQGSLPARYRADAAWLANNLIYNKVRQFDTAGGGGYWTNLNGADRPPLLMGRDALEAEAMVATTTTGSKNLVFGDFQNFVITDRVGMAVEFIPHLVGTNRRPTGQRGWFAYYRTGSGVVNAGGFRLLNEG
jgi:HK97 family phage major capsid protein